MSKQAVYRYSSNGKLLLTGEYLVLQGALSLSLPTKAGQLLYVYESVDDELLLWKANIMQKPWFSCQIDPHSWTLQNEVVLDPGAHNESIGSKLIKLLKTASDLKGSIEWLKGVTAVSEIEFDIRWGLGSSSSLISNVAWWADVDPFKLFKLVSSGSGYDVASARSDSPILYRSEMPGPEVREVSFYPDFSDRLAFVYLGRKQDSSESVKKFLSHALVREKDLEKISGISEKLVRASQMEEYEALLLEHENILSGILDRPPIKQVLFRDYKGLVKSLGAWGGDFVHISLESDLEKVRKYFMEKGMDTVIPYDEMIKHG